MERMQLLQSNSNFSGKKLKEKDSAGELFIQMTVLFIVKEDSRFRR